MAPFAPKTGGCRTRRPPPTRRRPHARRPWRRDRKGTRPPPMSRRNAMSENAKIRPDEEVAADLAYVQAYAQELRVLLKARLLAPKDNAMAARMAELAAKAVDQVRLRTAPDRRSESEKVADPG